MMPRQNRVDPWGDLHAVEAYGMFTGNRGCLVGAEGGTPVRHHNGSLWIICKTRFRGWRHPLEAPRTWTPLFFLDDAVALAAGHRPCGLCRRDDYLAYRHGVTVASKAATPVLAAELNRRLATERLNRNRKRGGRTGPRLDRAADRLPWNAIIDELPTGVVVLDPETAQPHLLATDGLHPFSFDGWGTAIARPTCITVEVLTPPTSVAALANGFEPTIHRSGLHSSAAPASSSSRVLG